MGFTDIFGTISGGNNLWLYVLNQEGETEQVIYRARQDSGIITLTELSSLFVKGRLAKTKWGEKIFLTGESCNLLKLQRKTLSTVNTDDLEPDDDGYESRAVSAKYCINADDHLMLANVTINSAKQPLMLVWSDLYDPENFVESTGTEAGYFILQAANEGEITGLGYQKGYVIFTTKTGIHSARYVGYSAGLFEFGSISNSIGCRFHYSLVQAKDILFFAGHDNFYAIDGTMVESFGDPVWELFTELNKNPYGDLPGFADVTKKIVYWRFIANGEKGTVDGKPYELIYNYEEQKWALRASDGIVAFWENLSDVVTSVTCDELPVPCSSFPAGVTCADFKESFTFARLAVTESLLLKESSTTKAGIDGKGKTITLETKDFIFNSIDQTICVDKVKLLCQHTNMLGTIANTNGAYIKMQIGARDNLSDTIRWSSQVEIDKTVATDVDNMYFHFRPDNVRGKIFRIKLEAYQKANSYVDTIAAFQITLDIPNETDYVTR